MIALSSRLFVRGTVVVAVGAMLVAIGACGGEARAPSAPESLGKSQDSTSTDPSTIEEAQERIAVAKAQLGRGGGPSGGSPAPTTPPAADAARPADPKPPPPATTSPVVRPSTRPSGLPPAAESPAKSATPDTEDHCGSPCRAIASMRRAVSALCRMTGLDDNRCIDAKRTLAESEGRISPCSC